MPADQLLHSFSATFVEAFMLCFARIYMIRVGDVRWLFGLVGMVMNMVSELLTSNRPPVLLVLIQLHTRALASRQIRTPYVQIMIRVSYAYNRPSCLPKYI